MSKSTIPSGPTVNKQWVLETLSKIAESQDPGAKLQILLNALLDTKKAKSVCISSLFFFAPLFHSMFRETDPQLCQLAATDANTTEVVVMKLFNLSFDHIPMEWNPWTLQIEQYEVPKRLSNHSLPILQHLFP